MLKGEGRVMKKVVVTGALQFIGYHLSTRLLNAGYDVIGIDSLANQRERKEEMLLSFGRNANFQFIDSPWTEVELKKFLCSKTKFMFHYDQEIIAIESNRKIPHICAEKDIPLIVLSSLEVFGKQVPDVTGDTLLEPVTELGKQKARLEACLFSILDEIEYKLVIFRLPHVYGPWQDKEECVHKLLYAHLKANKTMQNVSMKTAFVKKHMYIDDVIELMWLAVNRKFDYEIYDVTYEGDGLNSKIRNELSFEPVYTFEDGLKKQREHMLKMLQFNPLIYE